MSIEIKKERYSDLYVTTKENWDIIWNKGILKEGDTKGANDWVKLYYGGMSDLKYGIKMYSPSLERFRSRSMSEFYGNGIVD